MRSRPLPPRRCPRAPLQWSPRRGALAGGGVGGRGGCSSLVQGGGGVCVCVCVYVYMYMERLSASPCLWTKRVSVCGGGVFFFMSVLFFFFFFFAALRVVWMPAAPRLATGGVLHAAAAMALECVLADACRRSPPPRKASSLAAARGNIRCRRLSHLLVRCAGDGRHPWAAGDRHPHGRVAVVAGVRCGSCSPR